ncbi:MAG: glycosyltransferase [Alphaproteobacteria bacterium]|nr:glycosyltransferase [Alphaproteobacteria bacterium]
MAVRFSIFRACRHCRCCRVPVTAHSAEGPMARSRLVFVSPQFLFPADAGGKIRTTGILRGMKGGYFDITLISPAMEDQPRLFACELGEICDRFLFWRAPRRGKLAGAVRRVAALASRLPASVALDRSRAAMALIADVLATHPDVVVADFVHAAVLFDCVPPRGSVVFTHNVEAEIFGRHAQAVSNPLARAIWHAQRRKMAEFEARRLPAFAKVIAVSERDLGFFLETYGVRGAETIPTGVDFDYFGALASPPSAAIAPRGGELVFTGSMDWPANIDAMQYCMNEIWPLIAVVRPEARLTVVGRDPPSGLMEKARARRLNWRFTGFVDDVRPFIRDADLYVVPLRVGGGTRIKIYEAMAMRRPVVSTSIGVEGLPIEAGNHYRRADTADAFADEVLRLLAAPAQGAEMAETVYDFILKRYSIRRVARTFEDICKRAADPTAAPDFMQPHPLAMVV